jgi:hypothetical protein
MTATISLPTVQEEVVDEALRELEEFERGGDASAGPTAVRLEVAAEGEPELNGLALLSNIFLSSAVPLDVHVRDPQLAKAFPALGLASALSRATHERLTTPADLGDDRWSRTWTPATREAGEALFALSGEPAAKSGLFGPTHATFNDPHLTAPTGVSAGPTRLLRRWLTRRLEERALATNSVAVIAFFLDQLIGNVREHAVSDDRPPIRSQLHISLSEINNTLVCRLIAVDTGPGIEHTLRPKLPPGDTPTDSGELLTSLLRGQLAGWGRARGIGLSRCFQLISDAEGASMLLATELVRCYGAHDADLRVVHGPRVAGTVAAVSLPI